MVYLCLRGSVGDQRVAGEKVTNKSNLRYNRSKFHATIHIILLLHLKRKKTACVREGNPQLNFKAMLLKNLIFLSVCLLALTSTQAIAFQNTMDADGSKKTQMNLTITEDKFPCFQSLECLKRENIFPDSNLKNVNIFMDRMDGYITEGSSDSESLYAVYNRKGELVKATVIQRDIPLPIALINTLGMEEFSSWTVVGNELEIKNFDKNQMVYKVILQNGNKIRVEHFNKHGEYLSRYL